METKARQELMRPLDFIVTGPQASGENWLARQLDRHPDLHLLRPPPSYATALGPEEAALSYIRREGRAAAGILDPFAGLIGHVDYHYVTISTRMITELVQSAPALRVVLLLRSPPDRILAAAGEVASLAQLALDEITPEWLAAWLTSAFQRRQREYSSFLQAWGKAFPRNQLLTLWFEDLMRSPITGLDRCCQFLGVGTGLIEVDDIELSAAQRLPPLRIPHLGEINQALVTSPGLALQNCGTK